MPLRQHGIFNHGGDLDNKTSEKIDTIFGEIDKGISEICKKLNLPRSEVRLLKPVHYCVLSGDEIVFVVMAVRDVGSIGISQYLNWSGKQMDMPTAVYLAERDLDFKNPFGIHFPRHILEKDISEIRNSIAPVCEQYIQQEIDRLEKLEKIVKINPIFLGRDFLMDQNLVFTLSPFSDPYNLIYSDHIQPTIEKIGQLKCMRADDIYGNRPIIEDIWQKINEARIVVAELTGRNPNVFYETGIAHTVGKEVILITQTMQDVPFDLKHLRCIVYEYTPRGMSNLEENLENTVRNILTKQRTHSQVT